MLCALSSGVGSATVGALPNLGKYRSDVNARKGAVCPRSFLEQTATPLRTVLAKCEDL